MNAPETITNARGEYVAHLARLAALKAEDAALAESIQVRQAEASAQLPAEARLTELLATRRRLEGDVSLGYATQDQLAACEHSITAAENAAKAADRTRRVALAGAERLTEERNALAGRIKAEVDQGAALGYAAGKELLALRLDFYAEALHALGRAHVDVVGAALAVDSFADVHAQPARLYTVGHLPRVALALQLPENMPGLEPDDFMVLPDASAFARAREEALKLLESKQ